MQDILNRVAQLKRPKLLMRAAKSAAVHYRRDRELARIFPGQIPQRHAEAICRLIELERDCDERRCTRGVDGSVYSPSDHLLVLIALVGEVQLLRSAHQNVDKA